MVKFEVQKSLKFNKEDNMTLAIRYKILGRDVYILQSEHQNVEKVLIHWD